MTTGYEQVLREREMEYDFSRKRWAGRRGTAASVARGLNSVTFRPAGKLIKGVYDVSGALIGEIYNRGEEFARWLVPGLLYCGWEATKGLGRGVVKGGKLAKMGIDSVADNYARANIVKQMEPEAVYQYDPTKSPFQNGCAERGQRRINAKNHRRLEVMADQLSQRGVFVTPEDLMRDRQAERQYQLKVEQVKQMEAGLYGMIENLHVKKRAGTLDPADVTLYENNRIMHNTLNRLLKPIDRGQEWKPWRG